jgi:ribose-phosphate pyrophosphokinase
VANLTQAEDLPKLMLLYRRLKDLSTFDVNLFLPYLPYGRNDKRDDSFGYGTKMFGDMLNTCYFNRVFTVDTHSTKSFECINRLYPFNSIDVKKTNMHYPICQNGKLVIASDKGARQRLLSLGYTNIIECEKVRDNQGKIIKFQFNTKIDDLACEYMTVIDDLCDGGATFIKIAELIRQYNNNNDPLILQVTHGIFSKGYEELSKLYDKIITTDTYKMNMKENTSNVEIIPITSMFINKIFNEELIWP